MPHNRIDSSLTITVAVWIGVIYRREPDKRIGYTKSTGCERCSDCYAGFEGFYNVGGTGAGNIDHHHFFVVGAWLNRFAFRIDLSAGLFAGPIVGRIISLLTTVARTIGVSMSNPANALKED